MSAGSVWKRASARISLICALMAFGAAVGAADPGAATSRTVNTRNVPTAVAARALSVNETAQLHLVSHHRGILNEEGKSAGTPGGLLRVSLKISYTEATITFTQSPSGGTLSGEGKASFYARGSIAHFTGSVSITRGTGRYAHASAKSLHIQGTFQRSNYALSLKVNGKMYY
jgi:hypothetical protein